MPWAISQDNSVGPSSLAFAELTVEIGGVAVQLWTRDSGFRRVIEERYEGFLNPEALPECRFEIQLISNRHGADTDEDVSVFKSGSKWCLKRGNFQAEWDLHRRTGWIRQCANPYSIDSVLRITHSLLPAMQGGFQLHASSTIRNGRAFLLAGVSGVGKTTMAKLAPSDAIVLTDEISYIRRIDNGYRAYGTPFAGELQRPGANHSAPVQQVCLLRQGERNKLRAVSQSEAIRCLMRHVLFFARDNELVEQVLDSVVHFAPRVEVVEMEFTPDRRAWELIQ